MKLCVNREYKDTVFRMLFKEKARLLELYNAVNDTDYQDPEALEIVTLENAIYMSMKNDVSCLIDMRIQLYEHQSTVNPNLPFRDLMYVCEQYEKYTIKKDLYSRRLVKLPTPRFVVFYNGREEQPERKELYLSTAFEISEEDPALELRVTQLNINPGYNEGLLRKCPALFEYMEYVNCVRAYQAEGDPLGDAVNKAADECIRNDVLKEFLLQNKAEVVKMTIFEYDEEQHKQTIHDEGYEEGYDSGYDNGYGSGYDSGYGSGYDSGELSKLVSLICRKLRKNKAPETIAEELEEDLETVQHICEIAKEYAPEYDVAKIVSKVQDILSAN
ncbi:MAG: hypothetical protein PUC55_12390 [Lachnospiraceae bacterium]|nr:hypothetical protein [Lachnospiraceae bacterium]HCJ07433.1 hypothetical protein [Lachnospiraceae bacterium]